MNANPKVMEYFPRTLERHESDAFARRIQDHLTAHGWGLWALEIPGVAPFIGFTGLAVPTFDAHFMPCVEIGWRLAPEFWGNGYATEAAFAALRTGFELGLDEVVSLTATINRRSMRIMEKLGMTHDPAEDFDHPSLDPTDPLRRHVVYRLRAPGAG
jgi:RimJ/RimL family protein N-acetyltransferase